jgi:glycine betaine/proline transport system ATP-binding protein
MTDAAIDCRHLWKIFGAEEAAALAAARDGVGKDEIRERFGCVVGVADVSFTVRPGEIFCVMGLSGSGKSTLVRHLNRLIEPTAGEIFIGGRDVSKLNPAELRAVRSTRIGMVFQNMGLLPHRTVIDNVALPLELRGVSVRERHALANEKLALVDLTGWNDRYPDELSGGMRQRVGLARAMAADPEILLMDEPFSALDPLIRRQLQDQFLELAKVVRKTTVFITHDLDEAIRLGDHIAIMKDGRIVQVGTPEDIVTAPADDYVADFVAGVSRLGLVTARRIMLPIDGTHDLAAAPQVAPHATLDALLDIASDTDSPIVVADGSGPVGWISKRALIRGIQGKEAPAAEVA